jgi:outer membrane protein assembly factor BamE (lipoprotein component of BamABCDE complex)
MYGPVTAAFACGRSREATGSVALAAVWLVLSGPLGAEVFRCTIDGRVTYSDRPCGTSAAKVVIEDAPTPKDADALTLQQQANLGRIAVGMTARQVEQVWGKPAELASEKDTTGTTERWIYNRSGETTTVQFQSGKVTKISKTQSLAPPPAPAADRSAGLTISEMEDREREEKAAERRFVRVGMTQEEVRGKLGPPWDRRVQATLHSGTAECWTYPPALRDPQTRTFICFSVDDTRLMSVDRTIER